MSKQLQPTKYSKKQQELNWINSTFHFHDSFCGCNDPIKHLLIVLNRNGKAPKPEEEFENIKCLITGETTSKEDPIGIATEELEEIFGDHVEEQEEHPTTSEG